VSTVRHTLPGPDYHDPAVYQVECERIFFRSWFYLGREQQVEEPGPGPRSGAGASTWVIDNTLAG